MSSNFIKKGGLFSTLFWRFEAWCWHPLSFGGDPMLVVSQWQKEEITSPNGKPESDSEAELPVLITHSQENLGVP
jgi:hypothetical protein